VILAVFGGLGKVTQQSGLQDQFKAAANNCIFEDTGRLNH